MAYPIVYPQKLTIFQEDDFYWARYAELHTHFGLYNSFFDALDGSDCKLMAYGVNNTNPYSPSYPDDRQYGYKGQIQCGAFKPTNVISISYAERARKPPT